MGVISTGFERSGLGPSKPSPAPRELKMQVDNKTQRVRVEREEDFTTVIVEPIEREDESE